MAKIVIFITGNPRAGKDTFAEIGVALAKSQNVPAAHISSIDPIKSLVASIGVDIRNKGTKERQVLSLVGDLLAEKRVAYCRDFIESFFTQHDHGVVFVQAREFSIASQISEGLSDIAYSRIRVIRYVSEEPVTEADLAANSGPVHATFENNGSTVQLEKKVAAYLFETTVLKELETL